MKRSEVDEEDAERVVAERDSLAEIYGEEFTVLAEREWYVSITSDPVSSATLLVPYEYPSRGAPTVVVDAPFATDSEISTVAQMLSQMHEESGGNEVLFEFIEYTKEYLGGILVATAASDAAMQDQFHSEATVDCAEDLSNVKDDFKDLNMDDGLESQFDEWTFEPDSTRFKQPVRRFSGVEAPSKPITIKHGDIIEDRKSKFEAHLATVTCQNDVKWVYSQLLQDKRIAKASHNVVCYRYTDRETGTLVHDNDDDGETGAGARLAEMMHLMQANDVFVMVSRWYGGIHLGPDRFRHFNNCAQQLLADNGFQRPKAKAKGKKK